MIYSCKGWSEAGKYPVNTPLPLLEMHFHGQTRYDDQTKVLSERVWLALAVTLAMGLHKRLEERSQIANINLCLLQSIVTLQSLLVFKNQ